MRPREPGSVRMRLRPQPQPLAPSRSFPELSLAKKIFCLGLRPPFRRQLFPESVYDSVGATILLRWRGMSDLETRSDTAPQSTATSVWGISRVPRGPALGRVGQHVHLRESFQKSSFPLQISGHLTHLGPASSPTCFVTVR